MKKYVVVDIDKVDFKESIIYCENSEIEDIEEYCFSVVGVEDSVFKKYVKEKIEIKDGELIYDEEDCCMIIKEIF